MFKNNSTINNLIISVLVLFFGLTLVFGIGVRTVFAQPETLPDSSFNDEGKVNFNPNDYRRDPSGSGGYIHKDQFVDPDAAESSAHVQTWPGDSPAGGSVGGYTAGVAGANSGANSDTGPLSDPNQIFKILKKINQYTYTAFFFLAVFFILLSAFNFLFARGEPEKIKSARTQIMWASIAIAIALISVGAAQIINTFLGTP